MAKTAADLLIERLTDWGVDTIFGYPGDGINGIFEALRTHQETMRFIQVRHEEAAAFAACGYAKYTGRLGVCLATSGPGGIHLLNGLYDAKCDGAPVLAITGHTYHDLIGTYYQQDIDLDKLFMDVAAYNQRVTGPAHLINVLDEAVKTALARRAVAHITIPKDVQDLTLSDDHQSPANIAKHSASVFEPARPIPPQERLRQAADLINAGRRVAILVGAGCLNARADHQGPAGQGRRAGRRPAHHRRPGPAGHRPLAGRHGGVRYTDHRGQLLPLPGVLPQAGAGPHGADRPQPRAHRAALPGGGGPGRRVRRDAARPAASAGP